MARFIITGKLAQWSRYSIKRQRLACKAEGTPEKIGGWYQMLGKIDGASRWLLVFFAATLGVLVALNA